MKRLIRTTACLSCAVACFGAAAQQPDESRWRFEFTPNLWAAGIKGKFGDGGAGTSVPRFDASFDNLLSNLDFAFMGTFEARKGRWGIMGDLIYMSLSSDVTVALPPNPIAPTAKSTGELDGTVLTAGGAYRVTAGTTAVDAIGGLRYYALKPSVSIPGPAGRVLEPKANWTDPILGIRVRQPLSEHWALTAYADVGGFGIGSDFSYQFYVGAEYSFSSSMAARIGYRQLRADYEQDDRRLDLTFGGIMLGLRISF